MWKQQTVKLGRRTKVDRRLRMNWHEPQVMLSLSQNGVKKCTKSPHVYATNFIFLSLCLLGRREVSEKDSITYWETVRGQAALT